MRFVLKSIRFSEIDEILFYLNSELKKFRTEVSDEKLYIFIDSLSQLLELHKAVGDELLIYVLRDGEPCIEIYDCVPLF